MKMHTMDDLYAHLLRDMYYAENQLIKTLPKLAKAARAEPLQAALQAHLLETKVQAERLEQIFRLAKLPVRGEKCPAMDGLIAEAREMMDNAAGSDVLDATIIAACRKVEHYEAGSYRTLIEIAKMLGKTDHIGILRNILKEEKAADAQLVEITAQLAKAAKDGQTTQNNKTTQDNSRASPYPAKRKTAFKAVANPDKTRKTKTESDAVKPVRKATPRSQPTPE